jgi:GAF domain-containing protein
MTSEQKRKLYRGAHERIRLLLDGTADWTAAMATVSSELHHAFDYFDWTGFYRTVCTGHLQVGPYQGGHGCIDIPYERGVCGACARSGRRIVVDDVSTYPGHIACSSTTRSEIVVPVHAPSGRVVAVLDVDSNQPAAFDDEDAFALERLCRELGERFGAEAESLIRS